MVALGCGAMADDLVCCGAEEVFVTGGVIRCGLGGEPIRMGGEKLYKVRWDVGMEMP